CGGCSTRAGSRTRARCSRCGCAGSGWGRRLSCSGWRRPNGERRVWVGVTRPRRLAAREAALHPPATRVGELRGELRVGECRDRAVARDRRRRGAAHRFGGGAVRRARRGAGRGGPAGECGRGGGRARAGERGGVAGRAGGGGDVAGRARGSGGGWGVERAGAGTWLGWGRPPERVEIVLSVERLAGVEVYEPADLTAVVGAGMTLGGLEDTLGRHGQWLPLDAPGGGAGTLGAAVSLAEAGPLRLAHGTPRDHVLGLTLVTGDGRVLELGGRVVKNVAGFDLVKLVTGARGTLGLICRVAVRLRPLPERDATLVLAAAGADAALEAVAAIRGARVAPAALELVSPPLAAEATGMGAAEWPVVVRLQGGAEAVGEAEARVRAAARDGRVLA